MLQRSLVFCLVIVVFQGLMLVKARRCSEMLKDKPCVVQGRLPLKLRCDRKTGEYFQIKNLSAEYLPGIWSKLPEAQPLAYEECRLNRGLDINLEYSCSVTARSLCPYADQMRNVKIEYFCWEVDPELLKGFAVSNPNGWVK
ncbi:uncharacterized protein [Porites lutea]|uniref:uncharacterized protein n=1 Tax=Porites lutea TaxID=51062 RepID=UPI003CC6063A